MRLSAGSSTALRVQGYVALTRSLKICWQPGSEISFLIVAVWSWSS